MKTLKTLMISCAVLIAVVGLSKSATFFKNVDILFHAGWISLAVGALLIYQVLNAAMWGEILKRLGSSLSYVRGTQMWVETECGKWLPGGFFGYGSRVLTAPVYGESKSRAGKALSLELLTTVLAWGTVMTLIFTTGIAGGIIEQVARRMPAVPVYFLILTVLGGVILGGIILMKSPQVHEKGKTLLEVRKELWPVFPAVYVRYVALCLWNGVALYFLSLGLVDHSFTLPQVIGMGAMAWIGGFLAIGVPGGIGVREGILVWLLSYGMDTTEAVVISVAWRVMQVLVELLILAVSLCSPMFKPPRITS